MTLGGYLLALTLTLAIEVPIVAGYAVRALGMNAAKALGVAVAVNLISHPLLSLWLLATPERSRPWAWTIGELIVVLAEAVLLARLWATRWGRSLTVAALANLASIGLGWAIHGAPW